MKIEGITIVSYAKPEAAKRYERKFCNGDGKKYARMLGNSRRAEAKQDVLLTVRSDALKVREAILRGDRRRSLHEIDWLVDNLDNSLAEGC